MRDTKKALKVFGWNGLTATKPEASDPHELSAWLARVVARLRARWREQVPDDPEGDWAEASRGWGELERLGIVRESDADDFVGWRLCPNCGNDWFGDMQDDYICPRCRGES